jgi:hypothetical protein
VIHSNEVVLKGTKGKNKVWHIRIWRLGFAITWNFKR